MFILIFSLIIRPASQLFMRILLVLALLLSSAYAAVAQSPLRVLVRDERTKTPLPGVTVAIPALGIGAATDAEGRATLLDVPVGPQQVQFSSIGYAARTVAFTLPQPDEAPAALPVHWVEPVPRLTFCGQPGSPASWPWVANPPPPVCRLYLRYAVLQV